MNLLSLLGLGTESLAAAGEPSRAAMGGAGRHFQALFAGALGAAGEPGAANAQAAPDLPGEATAGVEGKSSPATAGEDAAAELMETAEEQQAPLAGAALAGSLVTTAAPDASALAQAKAPAGLAAAGTEASGRLAWGASSSGAAVSGAADLPFLANPAPAVYPEAASVAAMPSSAGPPLAAAAPQEPNGGQGAAAQLAALTAVPATGALAGAAVASGAGTAPAGAPQAGSPRAEVEGEEVGRDGTSVPAPAGESVGRGRARPAGRIESAETTPTVPRQASPVPAGATGAAPAPEAAAAGVDSPPGSLPAVAGVAGEPAGSESWSAAKPSADEPAQPRDPSALLSPKAAAARAQAPSQEGSAPAPEPGLRSEEVPERALRILRELRADGAEQYRAELRLDPPGLGRVRIDFELSMKGDGQRQHALTRITVETAAAHEQLQAELPRIRALLAEQGLGGAEVELHLRQGHGQGAQEQQAQRSPWQREETGARAPGGVPLEWRSTHDGLIDLRA